MNKIKQRYLYSGFFITILFLGFCINDKKAFALSIDETTFPKASCRKILTDNGSYYRDKEIDINILNDTDNSIKIVFDGVMTNSAGKSNIDLFEETAINYLKSIDPFKKYFNRFSFYHPVNELGTCDGINNKILINFFDGEKYSAGTIIEKKEIQIVLAVSGLESYRWTGYLSSAISHELGHLIGNLDDEYPNASSTYSLPMKNTNCSTKENKDEAYKRKKDGLLYGSTDIPGCFYKSDDKYFRPSEKSVMKNCEGVGGCNSGIVPIISDGAKFNVISCGYIIAGIKGKSPTKENAEEYWPECCGLDTVKEGVEGCNPSDFLIEIPIESACNITETFTNTYTENKLSYDVILTAVEDIQLPTIIDEDNFFKINGKDVSVADDNGGRKIPKGEVITIPSDTDIKYEMLDNYCRNEEISFSLDEKFVDLKSPFSCFFNC